MKHGTKTRIEIEEQCDRLDRSERFDQFNADVLDEILIEEQNINPHDCEHSPNHLLPLRIEFNPTSNTHIIINRCMCCNTEVPDDYEISDYM